MNRSDTFKIAWPVNWKSSMAFSLLSLLVCAAVLVSATYAWFTQNVYTNVEPMQGSVSPGKINLVIAGSENGTYGVSTPVTMLSSCQELQPVTTADLTAFYTATARSPQNKVIRYAALDKAACGQQMLHGEVYVKAEYADADLYFSQTKLNFTGSRQLLAALRLGLVITSGSEQHAYIFHLDEITDTAGAEAYDTTGVTNAVVSAVGEKGMPVYTADPALSALSCCAQDAGEDSVPLPGASRLCRLSQGQPARVELFVYMEGCDENAVNSAQVCDMNFNLAFAGVEARPETL